MWMWIVILILMMLASGGSLFYLYTRIRKLSPIKKLFQQKKWLGRLCTWGILALFIAVLILAMDFINTVVCVLHLVVICLICDGVGKIISKCTKKTPTRYYAGLAALVLTAGYLSMGWYYAHNVQPTNYTITTEKTVDGLRVVQFADSHIGATFHADGFRSYMEEINALSPDVVLITGDFVDDGTSREDMLESCKALGLLKTTYGVYFSYGNHDRGYYSENSRGWSNAELVQNLTDNGVIILQDESVLIRDQYYIIGREDLSAGNRLTMEELTEPLNPECFTIVMDHQPHDYNAQADAQVDLVLSGHTHGGQFIPITYVGEWIGVNDRTYGYEQRKKSQFIVSSGIADWAIKFKTGCIAEYVVIDIQQQ